MPAIFPLLDSYAKKSYIKFKKYNIRFYKASSIFEAFFKDNYNYKNTTVRRLEVRVGRISLGGVLECV